MSGILSRLLKHLGLCRSSCIAPDFDDAKDYAERDVAIKGCELVECVTPGHGVEAVFKRVSMADLVRRNARAAEDADKKARDAKAMGAGAVTRVSMLENKVRNSAKAQSGNAMNALFRPWTPGREYVAGATVCRDGKLYCCLSKHVGGNDWDAAHWTECTLSDVIEAFTSAVTDTLRGDK